MRKTLLLLFCALSVFVTQAQQTPINIGVVTDQKVDNQAYVDLLQSEVKTILGQGYDVSFSFVAENNFDTTQAVNNYLTACQESDIVLAFGTINNIVIYNQKNHPKPTIVLGAVNSDFIEIPADQVNSEINNLTYVITPFSYKEDLTALYELYAYKKVAVLTSQHILDNLPIKNVIDKQLQGTGRSAEIFTYSSTSDWKQKLSDFDAVYFTNSYLRPREEIQQIIATVNELKIASFSSSSINDVEDGVLASNHPNEQLNIAFRRIALNIEAIVSGKNASELPIMVDYNPQLSININTASSIDLPLQYRLITKADFVGGIMVQSQEEAYSLTDIIGQMLNKNLSLAANKKNIDIQAQEIRAAKNNFLPDASASIQGVYLDPNVAAISNGQNPEISGKGDITVKQLIYSQEAKTNIGIQQELMQVEQRNYDTKELDAILDVAAVYFQVLLRQTEVDIQNQNLQFTKKNLKQAQQNFDAGVSPKADILRFQTEMAQNIQRLVNAANSYDQAINDLNTLLNNKLETPINIQDVSLDDNLFENYGYDKWLAILDDPKSRPVITAFLVEEAKRNAPELQSLQHNMAAIQKTYDLYNTGRYIPTVALQGGYSHNLLRAGKGTETLPGFPTPPNSSYNVGLNISMPIFQQNQRNTKRQKAIIQQEQLALQQDNLELSLERMIHNTLLNLTNRVANIQINEVSANIAKENLELTQNAYSNGVISIIQLIDAQNSFLQAQQGKRAAFYQYMITSLQLERAISHYFIIRSEQENQALFDRAEQYISTHY